MELDRYDRLILEALQQNGRISNQELADSISLSPSPCLRRVRALEESGLIDGYVALLNARKLGLTLVSFIQISMDKHTPDRFDVFEKNRGRLSRSIGMPFDHGAIGRLLTKSHRERYGCLPTIFAAEAHADRGCERRTFIVCIEIAD